MRPHIRLNVPSVSANAASVGDYVNKNYLHTYKSVTFDIVAGNADFFSGTLSTDSLADAAGRTVWGFIQQRSNSVNNSKLYKYFASGIGGAGSVSPFSSGNFKLVIVIRVTGQNYAGVQATADGTITIQCVDGKITYTPAVGQSFGESSYNIWQGDQTWTAQSASIVSVTYTPL